jgi:adenylate cyclase class 2
MNKDNLEIEAKYYVRDLEAIRRTLRKLGAKKIHPRILERNWRFDNPDRRLTSRGEVLRIREDNRVRLTYKRPIQGTIERMEIEIEVNDGSKTRQFLESLGYEVFFIYEKYRETFELGQFEVVLDEVPYGSFVEIEGPSVESIRQLSDKLQLQWDRRLSATYLAIFRQLKTEMNLPFRDATFEAFTQVEEISLKDLGLKDGFQSDPSGKEIA